MNQPLDNSPDDGTETLPTPQEMFDKIKSDADGTSTTEPEPKTDPEPEPKTEPTTEPATEPSQKTEPEPEPVTEPAVAAAGTETVPPGEPAEYVPNYKFSAAKKDYEFDEFIRPIIKDLKSEKIIRELHAKAYGLESVQAERDTARTQLTEQEPQINQFGDFKKRLVNIKAAHDRGDFTEVFKEMGIQEEKVLQWVQGRVSYEQLPPEQQIEKDRQLDAERRAYTAETSLKNFEAKAQSDEVAALQGQMDIAFNQDDVKAFQTRFDTALGKEGAFRDEVLTRGDLAWRMNQRRMTAQDAINEVMKIYGTGSVTNPNPPAAITAPPPQTTPQTTVLPNIRGTGSSPLKTKPKTIDDLRKIYADRYEK